MSGYNGRHGPNVSKYVANLNTIPTQQDLLAEPLNIEEDLALFTNNDFIDWNENDNLNTSLDFLETEQQQRPGRQHAVTSNISAAGEPKMDYPMTGKCLAHHYVSVSRSHTVFFASVSFFDAPSLYRLLIGSDQGKADPAKQPALHHRSPRLPAIHSTIAQRATLCCIPKAHHAARDPAQRSVHAGSARHPLP